jgi:hypothetical protein
MVLQSPTFLQGSSARIDGEEAPMKRRIVALFLTASASVAMFASPALATHYTAVSGT